MERLSIKTPDDFISFMGHSLGYWPQESLVCVTLDGRRIGATLRIELPPPEADTKRYVRAIVDYLATDHEATGLIFGMFTHAPWNPGETRPHEAVMECLTRMLSEYGINLRDGWLIGERQFTSYLHMVSEPANFHPMDRIAGSELNAELVSRGSSISPDSGFRFPILAQREIHEEITKPVGRVEALDPAVAIAKARTLWKSVLESTDLPSDDQAAELLANFKLISVRDRLIGDIPGLNENLGDLLLAQTKPAPHWARVDRATEVLLHLYTRADGTNAAPVLTTLGVIQWWEGRNSHAHECFQRALEADPDYQLARRTDQMLSAHIIAPWAADRNAAYQPPMDRGPGIEGMGMGLA